MPIFTNILSGGVDAEMLGKLIGQFDGTDSLPAATNYPNDTLAYVVGDKFYKVQGSSWVDGTDLVGAGGGGGSGDMEKSVYDTDDDGTVDAAEEARTLDDGSNMVSALQARDHLDATDNPHSVTAAQVGAAESSHDHTASDVDSGGATDGHVLTADGAGGAAWEAQSGASGGLQLVGGGSGTVDDLDALVTAFGNSVMYAHHSTGSADRGIEVKNVAGWLERASTNGQWEDISGSRGMNLNSARVFRFRATGDVTLSFSGSQFSSDNFSPSWTLVLGMDNTGSHDISGPNVTWIDGASWDDINTDANAINVIQFFQAFPESDANPYAALVWNGEVPLDPYVLSFQQNGTIKIVMTREEDVDVANASVHGNGSVSYTRNGSDITTRTTFQPSDYLEVTVTGQTNTTAVSIPRYS